MKFMIWNQTKPANPPAIFFFPEDKHIGMDRELNNRDIGEG